MAELCSGCGAELFAGQQFCRKCGAPTRKFSTAEIPTQILPEGQARADEQRRRESHAAEGQPQATTPLSSPRDTGEAGYRSRLADYVPPLAPPAPLVGGGRGRGWLWALLAVLVVSITISALVARQFAVHWAAKTKRGVREQVKITIPKREAPIPPVPPEGPHEADVGAEVLDEEGAEVSGDKTVITQTFPLDDGGRFAITNVAGDITIEGWDEEEAEVKITKRGGAAEDRAAVRILRTQADERLAFKTAGGSNRVKDVRYEVKLPRSLRQLEIASDDSNVRLSNLSGSLSISVRRGNIELAGVGGAVSTHTMKGHTSVTLDDPDPDDAQVFSGINGDVELRLKHGTNADLKAETMDGEIEADSSLGLDVQKRAAGQNAAGRLGRGGEPILVKTVSGNIKIKG